ncbi:MAG: tetratricopeptide repeat protein [Bacteroidales bacterium]|nr:tetratricopeptide repeat protein [Bacteroidales bacterium]
MFRVVTKTGLLLCLVLFCLSGTTLVAQDRDGDYEVTKETAIAKFERGDYEFAVSDFRKLITRFPKDPIYRYFTGACMTMLNEDLEQAAEYLYFASGRGAPVDVYYYLGEAHRKLYDFRKAKHYYIKFDDEAPRSLARERHSKLLIRSADLASEITSSYNSFEMQETGSMNFTDPRQFSSIKAKGGRLVRKPGAFFGKDESRDDLNSLMFMPENIANGQFVFFSASETGGKDGFQIMQAKKGKGDRWKNIRPVDALNTGLNEILPYYDPVGNDLYFASEGLEGLGGFDLYVAHYDTEKHEFSDPVNLGFPVNSVFDDYLFIPGMDLGLITVYSSRHATDSSIASYRLLIAEPRRSLATGSPSEIRNIANLGLSDGDVFKDLIASMPAQDYGRNKTRSDTTLMDSGEVKADAPVTGNDRGLGTNEPLSEALGYQQKADSLLELSVEAEVEVRQTEDGDKRWEIQKKIIAWNKMAASEQALADSLFSMLAVAGYPGVPGAIEKDTVINGITVYTYTGPDSITDAAKLVFRESGPTGSPMEGVTDPEETVSANTADSKDASEGGGLTAFRVLPETPYSEKNPFPPAGNEPDGAFYRIQIAVYSNQAGYDTFGGIVPISYEMIPDRGLMRYYAGHFIWYNDAMLALGQLRNLGYTDAYIVAWYNGKKMSYEKVRKLEKRD